MSTRIFDGGTQFMLAGEAADYIGTGAIHIPIFEKQIMDKTRKRGTLLQRVQAKQATGQPTRYFEKVAHDSKHAFVDPRAIDHTLDTAIRRIEHAASVKAMVDGISFGLFDEEVTRQQGLFGDLQAQDLSEVITDMLDAQDRNVWQGTATSLMDNVHRDYCPLTTQITKTGTIAKDKRLTAAICDGVAYLMYNKSYNVTPTAIYMNPMDKARLDNQEKEATDKVKQYDVEVLPGIKINGIMTNAGILPIITDIYCPVGKIAIVDENLIERQYVTSATPRMYQLGIEKSLTKRFIAILFDTFIVRGASYGHMILTIDGVTADTAVSNTIIVNATPESPSKTPTVTTP